MEPLIQLFKDGNQICALYGENLQEGTAGFGNTTAEALQDLAAQIEAEGITEEIDSSLQ